MKTLIFVLFISLQTYGILSLHLLKSHGTSALTTRGHRVRKDVHDRGLDKCLRKNCGSEAVVEDYWKCAAERCATSSSSEENTDPRWSFVPVPVASHDSHVTVCPENSLTDQQEVKYCTRESCYAILRQSATSESSKPDDEKRNQQPIQESVFGFRSNGEKREVLESRVCLRERCDDITGSSFYRCVTEECCFADRPQDGSSSSDDSGKQQMSRKRRVNDDVSQCIQSYCSGKPQHERILCIVKNCNRAFVRSTK